MIRAECSLKQPCCELRRTAFCRNSRTIILKALDLFLSGRHRTNQQNKIEAARGQCWVDVGFWGGVVPGNTPQLAPLIDEGVLGFKCFLTPSGVDEFRNVTEADLREALPELARLDA